MKKGQCGSDTGAEEDLEPGKVHKWSCTTLVVKMTTLCFMLIAMGIC